MQNDLDYNLVPTAFLHCIKVQCPMENECLRHKVMLYVTPERSSIPVVNPTRIQDIGKDCPYFFSVKKSRFALGITHLLDNVPHRKAKEIKSIMFHFFKRNTYYRILHKERLINPAEQIFIRQLFLDKGINEEPLFDKYVEEYEW